MEYAFYQDKNGSLCAVKLNDSTRKKELIRLNSEYIKIELSYIDCIGNYLSQKGKMKHIKDIEYYVSCIKELWINKKN